MLEERLTSQERDQVVLRIDQVLDGLGGRGIPGWYAYILPTASFLLSAFNFFHLQASSPPAAILGYTVMIASFVFVISTLIVKRGLLLGGSGRSCYFPGSIPGSGAYGKETQIFGPISVIAREVPVDILAVTLTFALQTVIPNFFVNFYYKMTVAIGPATLSQAEYTRMFFTLSLLYLGVFLCLCALAYYRRTRLNRL
jgi:hypothetical protein